MPENPTPFPVRVDRKCPPGVVFVMNGEVIVGAVNTRTGVILGTDEIRDILFNKPLPPET